MALVVKNNSGVLTYFNDGVQITAAEARALIAATPDGAAAKNERELLDKIATAITNNAAVEASMNQVIAGVDTFKAIASPTTAQRNAFISDLGTAVKLIAQDQKAQARQLTALARLAARQLNETSGT